MQFILRLGTPDPYLALGLSHDCPRNEVKKTFHALARKYHPDKSGVMGTGSLFQIIHDAFKLLSDDERRLQYDKEVWS